MNFYRCLGAALFIVLGCALQLQAQTGSVRGFIYEEDSGEPVIFTNAIIEGTTRGASTDVNGFFMISQVPVGEYTLVITYLGYDTLRHALSIQADRMVQIKLFLKKSSVQMQAVEISAERQDRLTNVTMAVTKATPREIKQIPTIGGVADLAQYLQILPGVIFTGDQGGQLFIRGGSPVQNLVLLDGMVLYNPFHSIGLFSVFDTEIIRSADIYTAGFGSNYGGRVSSVMDITTRDGNKRRTSGKVGLSTFQANALLEGPLLRQTNEGNASISYLLSAKHSYLDQSSKLLYDWIDPDGLPFNFTDLYGKMSFNAGSGSKLNVFGFRFIDEARFQSLSNLNWDAYGAGSNFLVTLPGSPIVLTGRVSGTNYFVELNEERDAVQLSGTEGAGTEAVLLQPRTSEISNFNLGLDFKVFAGEDEVSYGIEIVTFSTDFSYFNPVGQRIAQRGSNAELAAYGAYKFQRNRLILDLGMRFHNYSSVRVIRAEPRLGAKYLLSSKFRIKAAGGRYSQNLIAANSDQDVVNLFAGFLIAPTGLPNTLTMPDGSIRDVNNSLQTANHYLVGFEYDFNDRLSANVEGYIKDFRQLTDINRNRIYTAETAPVGADPITFRPFTVETGLARGIDMTLKYEAGQYYIWAVYSLSKVDRWDGVRTYSPIFDRRHNANLVMAYRFGKNQTWEVNGRWNYGSGFPFTQNQGFYLGEPFRGGLSTDITQTNSDDVTIQFAELNQGRLPDYHRLDLTIKRSFIFGPNSTLDVVASVTNLYNRDNIFYVDRVSGSRINQLPLLPSFGMMMSF